MTMKTNNRVVMRSPDRFTQPAEGLQNLSQETFGRLGDRVRRPDPSV